MESRRALQKRQPYCVVVFFYAESRKGGGWLAGKGKKRKMKTQRICPGNQRFVLVPRVAFVSCLTVTLFAMAGMPVFASDIFETAKNAMQTVYTDVAGIATGVILTSDSGHYTNDIRKKALWHVARCGTKGSKRIGRCDLERGVYDEARCVYLAVEPAEPSGKGYAHRYVLGLPLR